MKNIFRKLFRGKLVAVIQGKIYWTDYDTDVDVFYYLFEHKFFGRSYIPSGFEFSRMIVSNPAFLNVVHPWLLGMSLDEYKDSPYLKSVL